MNTRRVKRNSATPQLILDKDDPFAESEPDQGMSMDGESDEDNSDEVGSVVSTTDSSSDSSDDEGDEDDNGLTVSVAAI